jgi:murein DD-endopeptidase MepM/ murein hydrolase activator NlpD
MTLFDTHSPDRRQFLKAPLLAGLFTPMLLHLPEASAAETEACGISAMDLGEAAVGRGFRLLAQYLERRYPGYYSPVDIEGRGRVYVRHTGRDFGKPIGMPVRAVAPGRLIRNWPGRAGQPASKTTFVVGAGGVHWVYSHILPAVHVGQDVHRGQLVGYIANPFGASPPHVHVGALKVAYPPGNSAVDRAISAGRAFGRTPAEAQANALRYTNDPLLAFARSLGRPC